VLGVHDLGTTGTLRNLPTRYDVLEVSEHCSGDLQRVVPRPYEGLALVAGEGVKKSLLGKL
jgi:hypothetical protein